ncbi:MAG: N-acetylmuramoyl-L-alanine amidase [Desulfobacterales bacterium]|jgi:N-acetylmuramoyl-L-alanine amidase|nr:N-acetylmuramoyl-L-alanine amidase [Desulfobacterales bacterium]
MLNRAIVNIGLMCVFAFMALTPYVSLAETAESRFLNAEAAYRSLRGNASKQKYRHNWLNCIKKYQKVHEMAPSGPWAAAGLYWAGKLYDELFRRSGMASDRKEALNRFEAIIKQYPASRYNAKAEQELRRIGGANFLKAPPPQAVKIPNHKPIYSSAKPSQKKEAVVSPAAKSLIVKAPRFFKPGASGMLTDSGRPADSESTTDSRMRTGSGLTTVSGLRFWSNANYTRIVIDVEKETTYAHRLLKKDPSIDKPQRLYVDFDRSRLGDGLQKLIPINDDLLLDARAGQYTPECVRVVVDIKSFKTYKVFSLRNPFRIVVDVWGDTDIGSRSASITLPPSGGQKEDFGKSAIARQLALGVRRIVIDPGHGGKDFGAPGYKRGVYEKDVVLQIGKRLAQKVRADLGCEVIMTRTSDRYLTLEERTAIANTSDADLFISIHTNAHSDSRAFGIETYFLNLATDNDAILVAARENATSTKNISDLQTILNDLMNNAKVNESSRLAAHVQNRLYEGLSNRYDRIKDKGVKQAPFYVLLGAQMPAILVETSFISNARECERLMNTTYQDRLTDAIIRGIKGYMKEINPTAFMDRKQRGNING